MFSLIMLSDLRSIVVEPLKQVVHKGLVTANSQLKSKDMRIRFANSEAGRNCHKTASYTFGLIGQCCSSIIQKSVTGLVNENWLMQDLIQPKGYWDYELADCLEMYYHFARLDY